MAGVEKGGLHLPGAISQVLTTPGEPLVEAMLSLANKWTDSITGEASSAGFMSSLTVMAGSVNAGEGSLIPRHCQVHDVSRGRPVH